MKNTKSLIAVFINGKKIVDSDIQGRFVLGSVKKGEHKVKLVKSGYETLEDSFQYQPMDVLYFKMFNTSQLITLAENALDQNDLINAERYLNRALFVEPDRPDILFLNSIQFYLRHDYDEARTILEHLINTGYRDNSVTLLLERLPPSIPPLPVDEEEKENHDEP
jgi:hypothetical protein